MYIISVYERKKMSEQIIFVVIGILIVLFFVKQMFKLVKLSIIIGIIYFIYKVVIPLFEESMM